MGTFLMFAFAGAVAILSTHEDAIPGVHWFFGFSMLMLGFWLGMNAALQGFS